MAESVAPAPPQNAEPRYIVLLALTILGTVAGALAGAVAVGALLSFLPAPVGAGIGFRERQHVGIVLAVGQKGDALGLHGS